MKSQDMQHFNPEQEQRFLALLQPFINLEQKPDQYYSRKEYNLERMASLAAAAGNPEEKLKIIHIAGTKGKGSTALFMGSIFAHHGLKSGVFSSPHLVSFRERFLVNNQFLPYQTIIEAAERLIAQMRQKKLPANFFEIMTVLALRLFADHKCSHALVETGIGGRLDATNYVRNPICCVITSISFDHTELLGDTIGKIAAQKAGIIKSAVPVVVAPQPYPEQSLPIIEKAAGDMRAPLYFATAVTNDEYSRSRQLPPVQRENLGVALKTARVVGLEPTLKDLPIPPMPGRCQVLRRNPLVIVDGAHNQDSIRRLVESINCLFPETEFTVILGTAEGKDCRGILEQLKCLPQIELILTNPRAGKKSGLKQLTAAAEKLELNFRTIEDLENNKQLPETKNLLFTGSFFTALIGTELIESSGN